MVLVRQTYQPFAVRGYNLANVCQALNYQLMHHDALEDAKACSFITATMRSYTNTGINDWLKDSPSNRSYRNHDSYRTRRPN